ncbi:ABC transporter permease [Sedimentitalea sp. HM32M-2]|uniref:ABC transporter permease n=1 Tax=Sedimentitalea sp. HM32M-2 TaxID=3351566 RepID=UPI00364252F2
MDFLTIIQVLDSTIRLATPLLLACLAGLFSERAGIFDIGLEGKMLAAAFFSAAVAALSGSVWLGLLAGIAASMVLAMLHGLASITFRGNQLISGVAINFLAAGMTVLIAQDWFSQGGRTPSLMGGARFGPITLPFADSLRDVPMLGPVYSELLSGHSILVYAALAAVPATWWVLYRTRFGLRLRAVGENPAAVDTAGVSVVGLRYAAVAICGVLCGIAGAYLATALQAGFVKEMTAGRGFIALAALIFAKWRPWAAMWSCLLFGLLQAVALRYQNIDTTFAYLLAFMCLLALTFAIVAALISAARRTGFKTVLTAIKTAAALFAVAVMVRNVPVLDFRIRIPVQAMDALPYVLTVVILAGFVGKAVPPRAGGEPYVKER